MRRIHPGAVIWSLILVLVAACLTALAFTGQLVYYLEAGAWGALVPTVVILGLLFLISLRQWRGPQARPLQLGHLVFLLPLVLGLAFRPGLFSQSALAGNGVLGVALTRQPQSTAAVPLPDGPLVINEQNFLEMMDRLWSVENDIAGRKVEMIGFVYNDPTLGPEDFVLARLMITCCADDADVAGLLCRWNERWNLTEGQWVKVKGKLDRLPFYDLQTHQVNHMPFIAVEQLTSAEKPAQEYIYP